MESFELNCNISGQGEERAIGYEEVIIGLPCLFSSCKQRHKQYLFQTSLSKMLQSKEPWEMQVVSSNGPGQVSLLSS